MVGQFLARVANLARGPVQVHIPETFSKLGEKEGPLFLPEADMAFGSALKSHLKTEVTVLEYDYNINDSRFAENISKSMFEMISSFRCNVVGGSLSLTGEGNTS